MIEKLDIKNGGVEDLLNCIKKINEVVDVVNQLVSCEQARTCHELIHKNEAPADPYAEQRKWIGKICKFWNWDTGLVHYSKLITIKDINDGEMSNCPFRADDGCWYMYCEPVKPDDDIIYKGE